LAADEARRRGRMGRKEAVGTPVHDGRESVLLRITAAAAAAAAAAGTDAVVVDDTGQAKITQLQGAVLVEQDLGRS